jgi:hypothetical protein
VSTKILKELKKKYEVLERKHLKLQSEQRRLSNHLLTRKASTELINRLKVPVLADPRPKKGLKRPHSSLAQQIRMRPPSRQGI